jgi:hypothetical protein
MLERATAADAEVRTDRRDAVGALGLYPQQLPAIGMTRDRPDCDDFSGQRIRDIDRSGGRIGNTVATMADICDAQPLRHQLRARAVSSAPLIAGR